MLMDKESLQIYARVHHWLKKNYGRAHKCESKKCNGSSKSFQWSKKKKRTYEEKRNNFWMLCRSCHSKYDLTPEGRKRLSKVNLGKKLSKEHRKKMSIAHKGTPISENAKLKIGKANSLPILRTDREGDKVYFQSLSEAYRQSEQSIYPVFWQVNGMAKGRYTKRGFNYKYISKKEYAEHAN